MNGYTNWSAEDWVRHYAGPAFDPHRAEVGSAWDECGRRLPDSPPSGAMTNRRPVARRAEPEQSCPASRTPLLLAALGLGAGWYFFGPKPPPEAVAEAKKKVVTAAGVAAGAVGKATRKVSEVTLGLRSRAEKYARKKD